MFFVIAIEVNSHRIHWSRPYGINVFMRLSIFYAHFFRCFIQGSRMVLKLVEEGKSFLVYDRDESAIAKIQGENIKSASVEEVFIQEDDRLQWT